MTSKLQLFATTNQNARIIGVHTLIDEKLIDALTKCATGFTLNEVVNEYSFVAGQLQLTKRKVTSKDIPPDIKAIKLLEDSDNLQNVSDEEIEKEIQTLIKELYD